MKEVKDKNEIGGTDESEIVVDSFDNANKLLESLGYKSRNYQENYRKMYVLNWVEISIDSWPMIPTYSEIEGKSDEDVTKYIKIIRLYKKRLYNFRCSINIWTIWYWYYENKRIKIWKVKIK